MILDNNPQTPKKLQTYAREKMKMKMLKDILIDLQVCKLEGWNHREYLDDLKKFINSI